MHAWVVARTAEHTEHFFPAARFRLTYAVLAVRFLAEHLPNMFGAWTGGLSPRRTRSAPVRSLFGTLPNTVSRIGMGIVALFGRVFGMFGMFGAFGG
jgi:hypothetical protein